MILPWAVCCRAHTLTGYRDSKGSEAVLCRRGWEPGYFPGWHSTTPPSTQRRAWEVCSAPAQSFCRSTRRVLKAASGDSGGICETDTRGSSHACAGPCCASSAHTTSGCPGMTSKREGLRRCTSKHSLLHCSDWNCHWWLRRIVLQ